MLPDGHWNTSLFEINYGGCLTALGRYEEAETLLRRSYANLDAKFRPEHGRTQKAVKNLVRLYTAWDKPDRASDWRAKVTSKSPKSPKSTAPGHPLPKY